MSPFRAEVAVAGVSPSLPSLRQSHGVQCALLSLPTIVWLLSDGREESGAERRGREKVKIK